jgi:AcrR family transcriptional regulator
MPRVKTAIKQKAILQAASRAFSSREYHEVRTDDIAAGAGIGKGTIYRYFSTKEDLYFATIVQGFEELHECLTRLVESEPSPNRRLERIAREILRYFWHHRSFYALLYRNEQRFRGEERRLKKNRERLVGLVRSAIEDGIRTGQFRAADSKTSAEMFLGMLRAVNIFRGETDRMEDLADSLMEVFVNGIASEPRR